MTKKARCLKQLTEVDWLVSPDLQDYRYIGLGFLLRITEAVEVIAKNHNELIRDIDRYRKWWKEERIRADGLERTISALRGHITRLKNRGTKE